ncbi:ABC transporter ATP-binding protein [Alicyclobacillus fodiniaquatilis]|uniref:ABC transporter ATP-binding protein n=1 Tax=Alicyclobacillus fodiniaquatilis TaxID=1661150 RepID=A0ABW4JJ60_9BACL
MYYVISFLAIMAAEIITVQSPALVGRFTDVLNKGKLTFGLVERYSLWLVLIAIGFSIFFGIGQFRTGQMGRQFEYLLRRHLFTHWETLSTSYFRKRSIGDLLNHAMNDVQAVRQAISQGLNQLSNAIFLLCSSLFMMFHTVSIKLTAVSIIPILFIPLFVVWFGPRVRNASRRAQESLSSMTDLAEENFSAIRLIKATANESVAVNRFEGSVDTVVERQLIMARQTALFQSLIPLMGSISFFIALLYGGYLVVTHQILLGAFVAFTMYLALVINPLQQIGNVINNFQRASASLLRLSILLGEQPDITDKRNPVELESIRGDIEFRMPAFQYPDGDHPALADVFFAISHGQTLGIVGQTGSGKTTLVNLLPRIFDPLPGTVFVDGYDVRDLRLEDLRNAISYVPQDGFLFSANIGENISFSKENANLAEIEQAARLACIYEEVQAFPAKFDTVIGERGIALSGGQKQRTAIARAFLKDAPILILDDCLSAVDMNTEKRIVNSLNEVRSNRTTIIIAHRLSAVRHADLIIVLDEGRLVEKGTHDELIAQNGIYADMFALQQQDSEVAMN